MDTEGPKSLTFPAYIRCPACPGVAANIADPTALILGDITGNRIDRFILRNDQGKPGPSHNLVVCQHCHHAFKAHEAIIVYSPRTVPA